MGNKDVKRPPTPPIRISKKLKMARKLRKVLNESKLSRVHGFGNVTASTGVATYCRLFVIADLGAFLQGFYTSDLKEPYFIKAKTVLNAYSSGSYSIGYYLGYSLTGATFTDSNYSTGFIKDNFNTAYALKPFRVKKIGEFQSAKCQESNLWITRHNVNLAKTLNEYLKENREETDQDVNLNLIGVIQCNASQTVTVPMTVLDLDFQEVNKTGPLGSLGK